MYNVCMYIYIYQRKLGACQTTKPIYGIVPQKHGNLVFFRSWPCGHLKSSSRAKLVGSLALGYPIPFQQSKSYLLIIFPVDLSKLGISLLHGVYLISIGHDPWTFRPFMAPLDPPGLCESFGKSFQGMFTAKKMTFATAGTHSAPPICPLPRNTRVRPNPNSCFWTSGYLKSYRWWSWDLEVP